MRQNSKGNKEKKIVLYKPSCSSQEHKKPFSNSLFSLNFCLLVKLECEEAEPDEIRSECKSSRAPNLPLTLLYYLG